MPFCPCGSLCVPHLVPHPRVPGLQADGTDGGCLQVAHACGVTQVVVGCSAALVKPLAKAALDLASVLHTMKGEGRKRLGPWQAALAPNLSQLPWQSPLCHVHWALLPAGPVPWAAPEGEWLFLLYWQVKWGTEWLWACSGVMQGANHTMGRELSSIHPPKHAALCLFSKTGSTLNTQNVPLVGCHLPLSPIYSSIKNMQQWHGSNLDLILHSSGVSGICCKPLFAVDFHVVAKICSGLQVTRQDAHRGDHWVLLLLNFLF